MLAACNPILKDEKISTTGHQQIADHWRLKNTQAEGDSLVLETGVSAVISKFSVQNFDLSFFVLS